MPDRRASAIGFGGKEISIRELHRRTGAWVRDARKYGSLPAIVPIYLDSALVAKFNLNEPGRDAVRDLARKAGIVATSGSAVAEVSGAFHRKLREGATNREVFNALHGQFQYDLENGLWRLMAPTEVLLEQVRGLFARLDRSVFLRSIDALHLVTVKAERFERIYSNDRYLLAACSSVGLEGTDPIAAQP